MVLYAKPAILDAVGTSHCLIEASAGTGKTFTLEHLIVQLILDGEVALDQLLVVTFTKKAALELKNRVRAKLVELVQLDRDQPRGDDPVWELTEPRLEALRAALTGFDRVTIATIHSFCQEVLKDAAFEGGHLLEQEQVASDRAFDRAFTSLLRTCYATGHAGLLEQALKHGGLKGLRELLKEALQEADRLDLPAFRDVRSFLEAFPVALARDFLAKGEIRRGFPKESHTVVNNRLKEVLERLEAALASDQPEQYWQDLEDWKDLFVKALDKICVPDLEGDALRLSRALADTFNFKAVLVAALLPPLRAELARAKAEEGLYDFDDMIALVDRALAGDQADALLGRLRERYHVALIDEFQDTDSQQWRIFSRIFLGQGGHRLILVGDPKQAIYGFRGGDLPTYMEAKATLGKATGAEPLHLTVNHRSTAEVISSYNAVFDPAGVPGFFSAANAEHYRHEVTCGKPGLRLTDAAGGALPALRLVDVIPSGPSRSVKLRTADALARAVRGTLEAGRFNASKRKGPELRPEDVYVLTNNLKEGQVIARALREEGVPATLYRQSGLFRGPEAEACRDILLAVQSPLDECRRAKALLGPFFGFSLREAEAARELPEGHAILTRLFRWREMAERGRFGAFFNALVAETGMSQRLLFLDESRRTLTNLLHILELLQRAALAGHCTLTDLALQVQRWIDDVDRPSVEDGDTQRLEARDGAVQVLTRHKSKGLEAPVVVLFGGNSAGKTDLPIHRYHLGGRRAWVGPVKAAPAEVQALIQAEQLEEWERLEYVALTRAAAQLILPRFVPGPDPSVISGTAFLPDGNPRTGPYRKVNLRLRALAGEHDGDPLPGGFERIPAASGAGAAAQAVPGTWTPVLPEPPAEPGFPVLAFQDLGQKARPMWVFNYTGLKKALEGRGGEALRLEEAREALVPGGPGGGKKFGTQVHLCLQKAIPASFHGCDLEAWLELETTRKLASGLPREARRDALKWVYRALAEPLPLPGGGSAVLARAEALLRELDFLTPYPEREDFLDGSMDVLFRWEGRAYLLDWKTDRLGGYDDAHLEQQVMGHYLLQVKIYTMTACRFLGIEDEAHYERAFGGVLYVFLRGFPDQGVWTCRPSWTTVQGWVRDLDALRPEQFITGPSGRSTHG